MYLHEGSKEQQWEADGRVVRATKHRLLGFQMDKRRSSAVVAM
jgi:hypothetical protein